MKVSYPAYYSTFRCIAGACPDSCCKEWEVDIDDATAAFYRTLEGPLGDRLRQVLKDTEDGAAMTIEDGRCPMWRRDGLCRIQAELGHDALCQTCRDFPRLRHLDTVRIRHAVLPVSHRDFEGRKEVGNLRRQA